ncbi:MAG: PorT family protein [Flavobacteriales bacterium]|nr:MAG: PorT family protein [Flavobacteriales bacterium]
MYQSKYVFSITFFFICLQTVFGQDPPKNISNNTSEDHQVSDSIDLISSDTIHSDEFENSKQWKIPVLSNINWGNLPYEFDDIMIIGGLNMSSLNFSNYFRELGTVGGWQIGFEGYYPIGEKVFFNTGMMYARTGFLHKDFDVRINSHQLVVPFLFAYELPIFRSFDWRIFFGGQVSYNVGFSSFGLYPEEGNFFRYETEEMNRFDLGMNYGLSLERDSYYMRLRGYFGTVKVTNGIFPGERDPQTNPYGGIGDTGMMQAFFIEFGYFLFRPLRKF